MGKIDPHTCMVCGTKFQLIDRERYVARADRSNVATAFFGEEPALYDVFDCPICGCQNAVNPRKRKLTPHEYEDAVPTCCCLDPIEEMRVPEWPRFEDGSPVLFGDEVLDLSDHGFVVHYVRFADDGSVVLSSGHGYGVYTRGTAVRPTPEQMADYYRKWPEDRRARDGR